MIEQIFILVRKDGTFTVDYIGIRNRDSYVHKQGASDSSSLIDFETLLTGHQFTLEDDCNDMRIWARRGEQLALGATE